VCEFVQSRWLEVRPPAVIRRVETKSKERPIRVRSAARCSGAPTKCYVFRKDRVKSGERAYRSPRCDKTRKSSEEKRRVETRHSKTCRVSFPHTRYSSDLSKGIHLYTRRSIDTRVRAAMLEKKALDLDASVPRISALVLMDSEGKRIAVDYFTDKLYVCGGRRRLGPPKRRCTRQLDRVHLCSFLPPDARTHLPPLAPSQNLKCRPSV